MLEEVYNFLYNYGFKKEEINYIEKNNEKIFFIGPEHLQKNIFYLESKNFEKKDVIQIILNNPSFLTINTKTIEKVDDFLIDRLNFTVEELSYLIKKNPSMYNKTEKELCEYIDLLLVKKKIDEYDIKKILLDN